MACMLPEDGWGFDGERWRWMGVSTEPFQLYPPIVREAVVPRLTPPRTRGTGVASQEKR